VNSLIYTGEVLHHRLEPAAHRFRYPVYFYSFDLSELQALHANVVGFGYNRLRMVSLRDRDYLEPTDEPLPAKIRRWLGARNGGAGVERIELITAARYFHYIFNPVSFYLCYGAGYALRCVVAEVNNTFGDRHLYLVPDLVLDRQGWRARVNTIKDFHVSPLQPMNGEYEFIVTRRHHDIRIAVNIVRDGHTVFTSALTGKGAPLTSRTLWRTVAAHPLSAALTVPRIVRQAATLHYNRRLPVYARPEPTSEMTIIRRGPSRLERFCMQKIIEVLGQLEKGAVRLTLPDGSVHTFGSPNMARQGSIHVRRYAFFAKLALRGDTGLGEAYVDGDYDSDDLHLLLAILAENGASLGSGHHFLNALPRTIDRLRHALRRNHRRGSRRNIRKHYDLSQAFFRTFLDDDMTYSCAIFDHPGEELERAQERKLNRIIDKAGVEGRHHVLEIGTGWGSFALAAARRTGCRVTSVTISEAQFAFARERVRQAGLEDRVEIKRCDYRDVEGQYDRIVSIEMLEAVGHAFLGRFFEQCERLLKPEGLMVLQVITFPDYGYDEYRKGSDWIRKHIFPGGHLPCLSALAVAMRNRSRLGIEDVENIGPHYATTLRAWRQRFEKAGPVLQELGFDETFRRKWRYYLSYCEAGFSTHILKDLQIVLARAAERVPDILGRVWDASIDTPA